MTNSFNPRFKTSKACEIGRVDRARFNEAVANGDYACAPATTKGASRVFDLDQATALFIFGQLSSLGLSSSVAGAIACEMYFAFRDRVDATLVVRFVGLNGAAFICLHAEDDGTPDELPGLGKIVSSHSFNVKNIRQHFIDAAEYERRNPVFGDDD